jgi:hypothetical protein
MHDTVCAFDADSPSTTPFWSVSLGSSVPLPDPSLGVGGPCGTYHDIQGEVEDGSMTGGRARRRLG